MTRLRTAAVTATAMFVLFALEGTTTATAAPRGASTMDWYRSDHTPPRRSLGSTVVVGLDSMRDLPAVRATYGFRQVRALPELHAAEVEVDPSRLDALFTA